MFEIGKSYVIHEIEGGVEGYSSWQVVEADMPLIKIRNGFSPDRILNTSSPSFVRAELSKHDASEVPVLDLGTLEARIDQEARSKPEKINYNHRHVHRGYVLSGASDGYVLTAQDMRDAIADLPDDAEIIFGPCNHGDEQHFYRFKTRGENLLSIELG